MPVAGKSPCHPNLSLESSQLSSMSPELPGISRVNVPYGLPNVPFGNVLSDTDELALGCSEPCDERVDFGVPHTFELHGLALSLRTALGAQPPRW